MELSVDAYSLVWKLLLVFLLVALNGFFVAAEFALVKIRDSQLEPLIAKGHRRANIARLVISNLDASLSACQLGITLASLALGWVGEPVFAALLHPVLDVLGIESVRIRHLASVAIGFSALTFLHIVAGEQAPKWLAIQRPLPTSLWVVQPLHWFHRISFPFIWLLNHASLWLLSRLGLQVVTESELAHSDEELRLLFAEAQKQRSSTVLGRAIVMNALDLKHRVAREVMRPRAEISVLNTDWTLPQCLEVAERTRFSRFPLSEGGDLDRTFGVVHVKDLYSCRHQTGTASELKRVARKLVFIPETARLETVLQVFLDRKLHFALVVDEYGGTVGMVTLENILEELVGQIQDEFDLEKPLVVQMGTDSWEIQGQLPLHELSDLVGESIQGDDVTTTSGWVTQRLGGFPRRGDLVRVGDFQLRVEDSDGRLVSRLSLRKLSDAKDLSD